METPLNRNARRIACTVYVCLIAALSIILQPAFAQTKDSNNALLTSWLNAQTNLQTWSADFTQVRTLKSLTQPLTATGHVWFAAPNRFRWELGKPPKTIAIRETDQLTVVYPLLKRAERYPLSGTQAGQWRDTLALLDAGFPRSRTELESRFNIVSQTTSNNVHEIALQPKSESARRFMPQIKIGFDTQDFSLHSTELEFTDGSTMKNIFSNAEMNQKIPESMFKPDLGSDYKITEPFKK